MYFSQFSRTPWLIHREIWKRQYGGGIRQNMMLTLFCLGKRPSTRGMSVIPQDMKRSIEPSRRQIQHCFHDANPLKLTPPG